MIQTFEEYKTQRYENLEADFLAKSSKYFSNNLETIKKIFLAELDSAVKVACKVQREENKTCAYISVSFLNTSVMENKPVLQIDFYDENWVYGESWYRRRFNADFLLKYWQEFIFNAMDENFYIRSQISKVEIKSLFWETLDKLIYLFAGYTKYFLRDISRDLLKAENFYVTCGTYLDWQERIFAQLPEIDLLNLEANKDTTFRPVKKKVFRQNIFDGLNLRNCYFEDCIFDRFTFSKTNLIDSKFWRCRFTNTEFTDTKFTGGNFSECYFKDCTFTNCSSNAIDISDEEYFATLKIVGCYLLDLNFSACDFSQIEKINCFEKN